MNRHFGGALALLFLASPVPALSQGLEGMSFNGGLEFEHTRRNGASGTNLSGELFLRYEGGLGFELGGDIDHDLETGTDRSVPYVALSFGIGPGELAVGAPQPVADMMVKIPDFAGIRELQWGYDQRTTSVVSGLAKANGEQVYGARLTAESGALSYGASVHRLTDTSGLFWQMAGQYEMGSGTEIEGTVEGEDGNLAVTVGANHQAGQFDMGLYLTSQRIIGTTEAASAFVGYSVSDALTVRGHVRAEGGAVDGNMIGVEAEYGFGNGAYAQFGAADGNNTSMTLDASIGFEF
ncbi:hypothetical protein GU927_011325 [Rhodobacteraceae bacterium HSP-20]|uniref:Porin domain-containing protein n=1 Tax=Paragemmobacter amnigenus TaxID=2852097 RepID=A0ABS6J3U7_9RHOB|nr:hypothetical protein [Rhodobacter amnigenus]MBU9698436.1 hypothetical protein [Rhodobacter amnigenus]MBV4389663.1 hypothetical protein [Rhodobacter amnigenus]